MCLKGKKKKESKNTEDHSEFGQLKKVGEHTVGPASKDVPESTIAAQPPSQ